MEYSRAFPVLTLVDVLGLRTSINAVAKRQKYLYEKKRELKIEMYSLHIAIRSRLWPDYAYQGVPGSD